MAKARIRGEVSMDGKGVEVGLAKGTQAGERFRKKMIGVGRSIGAAFQIGLIANFARRVVSLGSDLSDMAFAAGLGTKEFQALSLAARDAGASEQQLTNAAVKLRAAQGRVIEGDKKIIEQFEALGISAEEVAGMNIDELFVAVADGITKANNGAIQFNAIVELLGQRNAPKLLEALNNLSNKGMAGLIADAEKFGQIWEEDVIKKLDETADTLGRAERSILGFFAGVLGGLIDFVEGIATFTGAVAGTGLKEAIRQQRAGQLGRVNKPPSREISDKELLEKERAGRIEAARAKALDKDPASAARGLAPAAAPANALRAIGAGSIQTVNSLQFMARLAKRSNEIAADSKAFLKSIDMNTRVGGGLGS